MIVNENQKMVEEAGILCGQSLSVKYISDAASNGQDFDVSTPSPSQGFLDVRASESISNEISRSESVLGCSTSSIQATSLVSTASKFVPCIRSGSHTDIGPRRSNEDEHIRIDDLSAQLGSQYKWPLPSSFYAVFDGHGGSEASSYVKNNAMRLFFKDADLPQTSDINDVFLEDLENSHRKAFLLADQALANECSVRDSCGTTALTALVLGSHLLVANAGDCRAVLCRKGVAVPISQDHRPSYLPEQKRVEDLGGYFKCGYLNGELAVTRALGDWFMKFPSGCPSPLTAEPDIQQILLTEDDEFLIIGCDGIWDVMPNQEAVSLVRRQLRQHDDPQKCAKALVDQALCLHASDNLTAIIVCFSSPAERRDSVPYGNLVTVPAVEGKPQTQINRPFTRSFCAELVAKSQSASLKDTKKPLAEIVNGVVGTKGAGAANIAAAVQKKEHTNQQPKKVGFISPDEEIKQNEENSLGGRKSRPVSSKKIAKALTSILSARSKAACGLVNKPIANIDASDVDDELAAVEYVEDIYTFYKLSEDDGRVHDYMGLQPEINSKMRSILIDWLVEVHRKFELMPESLYLTTNIVDRYLSMKIVPRRELQLVGISSMLIACKFEEVWAPEVNDFIAISDNAYVREQVLFMEKAILGKLEWYLTVPTPYVFLVRYVKSSFPSDHEMENMVFFLAELGLMHYSAIVMYGPSLIAASAVYAARCTLNKKPFWTETLKHYTGYSEDQIRDCAKLLVSYHTAVADGKLKAVYRKFSNPDKGAVALFPPGKTLLDYTSTR